MASVEESLGVDGVRVLEGEHPELRAELVRIALLLARRGCRKLGIVPAADDVAVPAIAIEIGLALAQVTGSSTGVIDAQGTWPGTAALGPMTRNASFFATTRIAKNLLLLTPQTSTFPSAMLLELEAFFPAVQNLIFDLTGFDHVGEHLEAVALLDAITIVARAGSTTTHQLARWMQAVPPEQNLGVILVNG